MHGYEINRCKHCENKGSLVKEQLGVDQIYKVKCYCCGSSTRGYFEAIPAIDSWNGGTRTSISYESNGWIPSATVEKKKTTGSR